MSLSPAGRPAERGVRGAAPPDINDFPPAGEAGGKIINDFINTNYSRATVNPTADWALSTGPALPQGN